MRLTPTQRRIFDMLKDGRPHSKEELLKCLEDELSTTDNLNPHLSLLRKRVEDEGLIIACSRRKGTALYRLVNVAS